MLDIIIIALLGFSIYRGWRRGLFQILASFVLFIVAVLLGSALGAVISKALFKEEYLGPLGFFIGFLAIYLVGLFVIKRIKPKKGLISVADRVLGAVLSGVRMLLLIGFIAAFFKLFHLPSSQTINESKLYGVSVTTAAAIVTQLKPLAVQPSTDLLNDK